MTAATPSPATAPTPASLPSWEAVLAFWFEEITPKQWFVRSAEFDAEVQRRFALLNEAAQRSELWAWRRSPEGRLAEVIVLDQFSRNLYRDQARAFASDPMALALAQEAIASGADLALPPERRVFLYMPFMHSESLVIHEEALRLFTALGLPSNLDFERRHQAIIERFGRFPHRNAVLGRPSTPEEIAFLQTPGSSF